VYEQQTCVWGGEWSERSKEEGRARMGGRREREREREERGERREREREREGGG
jgi:hypothetical protein